MIVHRTHFKYELREALWPWPLTFLRVYKLLASGNISQFETCDLDLWMLDPQNCNASYICHEESVHNISTSYDVSSWLTSPDEQTWTGGRTESGSNEEGRITKQYYTAASWSNLPNSSLSMRTISAAEQSWDNAIRPVTSAISTLPHTHTHKHTETHTDPYRYSA